MKKSKYKAKQSQDKKVKKLIKTLKGEAKILAFINEGIKNITATEEKETNG